MIKTITLCVVLVAIVLATPRSEKVQEEIHSIAKEVKASSEYSTSEKKTILANLKEMNKDAKEYASAHGVFKTELKDDLKQRMSTLKREMHQAKPELEEEQIVASRIHAVHDDIKAVKSELKSKHLSSSEKKDAKRIVKQLESQYGELSQQTTREGRREIAKSMKVAAQQLKKYLSSAPSLESKKANIRSSIDANEAEFQAKSIPSALKSKIHSKFEEMKSSLEEESNAATLRETLKSELSEIKALASKAEKANKVHEDVAQIRKSLPADSEAQAKLRHLEQTADKYASSSSSSEKAQLKSQMDRDLSAVKSAMKSASLEEEEEEEEKSAASNDLEENDDDDF